MNEERFFLNKSNTKWLSVGIQPGYEALNGQKFTTEVKICGDTGSVSLGINGLRTVFSLFKKLPYFEKYGSNIDNTEPEKGIMISEFALGGSPCYKVINQATNATICIGLKSVEELMEMEVLLTGYIDQIDVSVAESKFLAMIESASKNWSKFYNRMLKEPTAIETALFTNFFDFFQACVEIKKNEADLEADLEAEQEAEREAAKEAEPVPRKKK